jgi:hypothetical protein
MRIRHKRTTKWLAIVAVAAPAIYLLAYHSMSQVVEMQTPFTVSFAEISTNPVSGRTFQKPQLYFAARSDGSSVLGSSDLRNGWRRIRNPKEKFEVTVADSLKLKTTLDYSYLPIFSAKKSHAADCYQKGAALIGIETVQGYRTYHYQRINALANRGKHQIDQWLAPDLNCYDIRTTGQRYNMDGIVDGVFEKRVLEILPGEPEVKLFAIPDDYAEVASSVREKAMTLRMISDREGADAAAKHIIPISVEKTWSRLDEHYDSVKSGQFNPAGK